MKLRTNLRQIAREYVQVCCLIPALIEQSGRKPEFFYKNMGIGKTTFYTRLKQCDWTPEELDEIGRLLEWEGGERPGKQAR